jgi:two-component system sensor histidine kinase TctE
LRTDHSLRAGLLLRLGIGIAILLILDAAACYYTALHFANLVYDRWLIDSADSLVKAVRDQHGAVAFNLAPDAQEVFRYDAVDKTYFKVASDRQGFIAGDAALADIAGVARGATGVASRALFGRPIREVTLRLPAGGDTLSIDVAETLLKRSTLTREILLVMVAPQIGLLIIALALSWLSIARGLRPLTELAQALESRDQDNLAPIPEAGLPRETRVLVARLNDLLKRIGNVLQSQRRFVADAAHQLRTPLAAMLLHTERAQRAAEATARDAALQALHASVRRTARLGRQLLTLARAEPDATAAEELQDIDLVGLARRTGEDWIPAASERNIDFGLSAPDHPVVLRGHELLLTELLANLIDNALRYGRTGGTVTVRVEQRAGPTLIVEDDGPGIAEAERAKVFERFYRTGGSAGDGSGLGLAIVKDIARLHRAEISLTAAHAGTGARFTVHFPQPESRSRQ